MTDKPIEGEVVAAPLLRFRCKRCREFQGEVIAMQKDIGCYSNEIARLESENARLRGIVEQYQRFTGGINVISASPVDGTDQTARD